MSGCQVWSRKLGAVSREPQFLLDRRICSLAGELKLFQKGTSLHGRHFPVDFGKITQQFPTRHARSLAYSDFCVAPVWVPGSCGLWSESTPRSLFAALSWAENLPHRPGETWLPRPLPGLRLQASSRQGNTSTLHPLFSITEEKKLYKCARVRILMGTSGGSYGGNSRCCKICIMHKKHRGQGTVQGYNQFFFFFFSFSFLAADISGLSLIKGRRGTPIHSSFRQLSPLLSPIRNFSVLSAAGQVRLPSHPPEVLLEIAILDTCRGGGSGG